MSSNYGVNGKNSWGEGGDYEKEEKDYKKGIYHWIILLECICVFFWKEPKRLKVKMNKEEETI